MKRTIENRDDVALLVKEFYDRVQSDDQIGYIFNDIVKVNWTKHLPVMTDFWENVLFFTGGYIGNPIEVHKHLHKLTPLTALHFERWTSLFLSTVDDLFEGEKAELAKQRARSIATVMQIKLAEKPVQSL